MEEMIRLCLDCGQNISRQPIYDKQCYSCKREQSENRKYVREVSERGLRVIKREGNFVYFTKRGIVYKGTISEYGDIIKKEINTAFDFHEGITYLDFDKVEGMEATPANYKQFQKEELSEEAEMFKKFFPMTIGLIKGSSSKYKIMQCNENSFIIKLTIKEKKSFSLPPTKSVVKELGYFIIPYPFVEFVTTDDEVNFVRGLGDIKNIE